MPVIEQVQFGYCKTRWLSRSICYFAGVIRSDERYVIRIKLFFHKLQLMSADTKFVTKSVRPIVLSNHVKSPSPRRISLENSASDSIFSPLAIQPHCQKSVSTT